MLLRAEVNDVGSVTVVSLSGRVDMATIPTLQNALVRAVGARPGSIVAVDLDSVDVLDDVGIGVIVGAAGRARALGGDVVIVCTSDALLERFSITRLDRALTILPSITAVSTEC